MIFNLSFFAYFFFVFIIAGFVAFVFGPEINKTKFVLASAVLFEITKINLIFHEAAGGMGGIVIVPMLVVIIVLTNIFGFFAGVFASEIAEINGWTNRKK